MTLFVVVQRNKRDGKEYLLDATPEGHVEYADAVRELDANRLEVGDDFDLYVGRVVRVEEES